MYIKKYYSSYDDYEKLEPKDIFKLSYKICREMYNETKTISIKTVNPLNVATELSRQYKIIFNSNDYTIISNTCKIAYKNNYDKKYVVNNVVKSYINIHEKMLNILKGKFSTFYYQYIFKKRIIKQRVKNVLTSQVH